MPRKSWWARLPFGARMTAGSAVLLIVIGTAVVGLAQLADDDKKPRAVTTVGAGQADAVTPSIGDAQLQDPPTEEPTSEITPPAPLGVVDALVPRTSQERDLAAMRDPRGDATHAQPAAPGVTTTPTLPTVTPTTAPTGAVSPAPTVRPTVPPTTAPAKPVITTRTETEVRKIPYKTVQVRDPEMPRGTHRVESPGAVGKKTLRYLVTLTDGRPTGRKLISAKVTKKPRDKVVAVGSARVDDCDEDPDCLPPDEAVICLNQLGPDDLDGDLPLATGWVNMEPCA